jgi:hypothetical protein
MATGKIIKEAIVQEFVQRVAFLALRAAQDVASESPDTANHEARVMYADRVFRGEDRAVLLTLHIVAASDPIRTALEDGTHDDVQDSDIEAALGAVWDARANAFGGMAMDMTNLTLEKLREAKLEVENMVLEARSVQRAMQAQPPEE